MQARSTVDKMREESLVQLVGAGRSSKYVKIVEAEICPDHVHMLVEIPPSISVSYFVGYLKGKSTLMIFERHANLNMETDISGVVDIM